MNGATLAQALRLVQRTVDRIIHTVHAARFMPVNG